MNYSELKQHINSFEFYQIYLNKVKTDRPEFIDNLKRGLICPECNNGAGKKGTGLEFNKKANKLKCFSCNEVHNYLFDIHSLLFHDIPISEQGTENDNKKIKLLCEYMNINTDNINYIEQKKEVYNMKSSENINNTNKTSNEIPVNTINHKQIQEQAYLELTNNIEKLDFLKKARGIDTETLTRFNIGYISEELKNRLETSGIPLQENMYYSDCYVIPFFTGKYSDFKLYNAFKTGRKYYNCKNISNTIYNFNELLERSKHITAESIEQAVFICEGEFDTLSYYSLLQDKDKEGKPYFSKRTVIIGMSANFTNRLNIELTKLFSLNPEAKNKFYFIPVMDNDEAGRQARNEIIKDLKNLNCKVITGIDAMELYGDCKDTNEMFLRDKDKLSEKFHKIICNFKDICEGEQTEALNKTNELLFNAETNLCFELIDWNKTPDNKPIIYTGISMLDSNVLMNTGLPYNQTVIIAEAGIGKSTFTGQIADNIAKTQPVILFSLEMPCIDNTARSISRQSFLYILDQHLSKVNYNWSDLLRTLPIKNKVSYTDYECKLECIKFLLTHTRPITANEIRIDKNRYSLQESEKELLETVIKANKHITDNIYIYDILKLLRIKEQTGIQAIGPELINFIIEQHLNAGQKPVIIIDYLQRLESDEYTGDEYKRISDNANKLRNICLNYSLPMILISSLNRQSQKKDSEINLTSAKGSGEIEFGAELLLAIKSTKANDIKSAEAEAKGSSIYYKNLEIEILKGRHVNKFSFFIDFYTPFSYFFNDRPKYKNNTKDTDKYRPFQK